MISIPNPCQQDWNAMTPAQQGRHCAACQKVVVDFTLMSDGQILDVLKKANGTTPCGRYLPSQLDRPFVDTRPKVSFAATMLKRAAALLLLVQSAPTAMAQQSKQNTAVVTHKDSTSQYGNPPVLVKGIAINVQTNLPHANISLYIREANTTVVTDSAGQFSFLINNQIDTVHITVHYNMQLVACGTTDIVGAIVTTDGAKSLLLQLPSSGPSFITAYNPQVVTLMGVPMQQPIIPFKFSNITGLITFVKTKPPFPKLPQLPPAEPSATVWGRLTNYWMGRKPY